METMFLFWGVAIGFVIGQLYFKYQIVSKTKQKVVQQVKAWVEEAEQ